MSKPTITEFLEARIAENERAVVVAREYATNQMFGRASAPSISIGDSDGIRLWSTDQLLAECAAKRAIIKSYRSCVGAEAAVDVTTEFGVKLVSGGMVKGLELAVKHLATAYADHPDYQQEWAL